ncbi:MAG: hypothetical protein AAFV95_05205 [Bacteroidota bacterium]
MKIVKNLINWTFGLLVCACLFTACQKTDSTELEQTVQQQQVTASAKTTLEDDKVNAQVGGDPGTNPRFGCYIATILLDEECNEGYVGRNELTFSFWECQDKVVEMEQEARINNHCYIIPSPYCTYTTSCFGGTTGE